MPRPTLAQRLIALNVPEGALTIGGAALFAVTFARGLWAGVTFDVVGIAWYAIQVLAAALLGFILGGIVGGLRIVVPLYAWQRRRNGGPFAVGDAVEVLVGKHRRRVARVYEVWLTRGQARAELDDAARRDVRDVFSEVQVRRPEGS